MPVVQTAPYGETMRKAVAGHQTDMVPATMISRDVEDAAGLAFGKPVAQGVRDRGVILAAVGVTKIMGVSVRERSLVAEADKFLQYESARIMVEGTIWVVASVAVVPGDIVHVIVATAAWAKTGGVLVPGARWESTAAIGELAVLHLGAAPAA